MAKITTRAGLNVGVELVIDEPNRTIRLASAGNLVIKDGCTMQALYSKLVDLWSTPTYQDSPFPMNALDALSGQYQIGIDAGGNANGWKFYDQGTRDILRDGGVEEYNSNGDLARVQVSVIGLGAVSAGAQLYFQPSPGWVSRDFVFDDQVNQMVQVYGDSSADPLSADLDYRTYLKGYCREEGKTYTSSVLGDTGKSETGAYIVNLLLSNENDLKIQDPDANMTNAPYDGITVEYYDFDVDREISGMFYPFRIFIEGNNATLEQIYTKVQYLLRQGYHDHLNSSSMEGKTTDELLSFVGDTLETAKGVFIDNLLDADSNRIDFLDQNGTVRRYDFVAAGTLGFNSVLIGAGSSYRLMFTNGPGAGDDYGEAGAITVKDATGADITGTVSTSSVSFSFDYDKDTLGGPIETPKDVTLVAVRPGYGKFAVATGTLTRSKGISLSVVAEADRAYI